MSRREEECEEKEEEELRKASLLFVSIYTKRRLGLISFSEFIPPPPIPLLSLLLPIPYLLLLRLTQFPAVSMHESQRCDKIHVYRKGGIERVEGGEE